MNRWSIVAAAIVISLPVFGSPKGDPPAQPATSTVAATTTAPPPTAKKAVAAPVEDSPLVAAAKRAGGPDRKKKSSIVITNDNLRGQNAKVTTTASQEPLPTPPPPTQTQSMNQLASSLSTGQKKEAQPPQKTAEQLKAEREKKMESLRARMEDDTTAVDSDPAQVEQQLERTSTQGQQPPPPKKP